VSVLVDSSVWIEYFRNGNNSEKVDFLIDENIVVINDLILAELVPFLKLKNHRKLLNLLFCINKMLIDIDWKQLIEYQYICLKNGLNGVGIPDLIIAQNAVQHSCKIYSLDNHFLNISPLLKFENF
jgi:predicted nucleic acid-binding protein